MVDSLNSVGVAAFSSFPARSSSLALLQSSASATKAQPQFAFRVDQVKISPEAQRIADLAKDLSDSKSSSAGASFGRGLQERVRALFAAGSASAAAPTAANPQADSGPAAASSPSGGASAAATTAPTRTQSSETPRNELAPEQQAASQVPPSSGQSEAPASPGQSPATVQSDPLSTETQGKKDNVKGKKSDNQSPAANPAPEPRGGLVSLLS